MTEPSAPGGQGRSFHSFVMRHAVLRAPAAWLSQRVASAPQSRMAQRVLGPLRDWARGSMTTYDVLNVVRALEDSGVPFYLAGGWGVDALVGRQTRSHRDLDVVIDEYPRNLDAAVQALAPLGFRLVSTSERRAWMPDNTVLEDDHNRNVDLDSLNWNTLAREFGPPGAVGAQRRTFEARVFAAGMVGGQPVPCLSAEVQLLFHAFFELKAHQRHDVDLLHHELGVSSPGLEFH